MFVFAIWMGILRLVHKSNTYNVGCFAEAGFKVSLGSVTVSRRFFRLVFSWEFSQVCSVFSDHMLCFVFK